MNRCRAFANDVFGAHAATLTIYSVAVCAHDGSVQRDIYDVRAQDGLGRDLDPDWTTPFWQSVRRERRGTSRWPLDWIDAVGDVIAERWRHLPSGTGRTMIVLRRTHACAAIDDVVPTTAAANTSVPSTV